MPTRSKPWQDPNNLIKDQLCMDGKPHRLKIVFLARDDAPTDESVPNGHMRSEVVYQCTVCKKYQCDRYVYPKIKRINSRS
jgi:hypothetical protein